MSKLRSLPKSNWNGPPMEPFVTNGGLSSILRNVLKCSFSFESLLEEDDDFLAVESFCWTKEMSLDGYILANQGLETIKQTLMMVTSSSIMVHMVAGIRVKVTSAGW